MVGADGLDDLVVVEQAVELLELGLEAEVELGHQGEQVGPVISMSEHGSGVPSVRLVRFLSLPTAYKSLENKAISHRKLVLSSTFVLSHRYAAGAKAESKRFRSARGSFEKASPRPRCAKTQSDHSQRLTVAIASENVAST